MSNKAGWYVIREPARRGTPARHDVVEAFTARYPEIFRASEHQPYPQFARMVEGTGKFDHARFELRGKGGSFSSVFQATVPATAAGVKAALRRVREQEAAAIEAAEARIDAAQRELQAAKVALAAAKRDAFAKGNVVRLAEVQSVVSEWEAQAAARAAKERATG